MSFYPSRPAGGSRLAVDGVYKFGPVRQINHRYGADPEAPGVVMRRFLFWQRPARASWRPPLFWHPRPGGRLDRRQQIDQSVTSWSTDASGIAGQFRPVSAAARRRAPISPSAWSALAFAQVRLVADAARDLLPIMDMPSTAPVTCRGSAGLPRMAACGCTVARGATVRAGAERGAHADRGVELGACLPIDASAPLSLDDDLADHAVIGVGLAVLTDDAAAQVGDAPGRDRHEPPFGGCAPDRPRSRGSRP